MKYEVVKLEDLSGAKASIYSVVLDGEDQTLFEQFVDRHGQEYSKEVTDIVQRIERMGKEFGAREQWFKLKEGAPGDMVAAIYDQPGSKLRLYCIRNGSCLVILGSGGIKPKNIRALQDDPELTKTNQMMRVVSQDIYKRRQDGEIWFSDDYFDLEGDLIFKNEED